MRFIACFVSLVWFYTNAQAQPAAGSLLLGGGAFLSKSLQRGNNSVSIGLSPTAGLFVTDRLMVGASASFFVFRQGQSGHFTTSYVSPFARYYLNGKGASRFYLEASVGLEHYAYHFSDTPLKENALTFSVGGGLTTWLTKEITLNNSLQYGQLRFLGEAGERNDLYQTLLWNATLQAVLPAKTEKTSPSIGKGTYLIGLQGSGGWSNSGVDDDFHLSVEPQLGYFVADHVMLGASVQLAFARNNQIIDGQYFARYYPLSKTSRWQPFAEFGGGTRFQFSADKPNVFNANIKTGIGLDYFITPSIALETQAYYYVGKVEDQVPTPELFEISAGLKFFLNDLSFFNKKK